NPVGLPISIPQDGSRTKAVNPRPGGRVNRANSAHRVFGVRFIHSSKVFQLNSATIASFSALEQLNKPTSQLIGKMVLARAGRGVPTAPYPRPCQWPCSFPFDRRRRF